MIDMYVCMLVCCIYLYSYSISVRHEQYKADTIELGIYLYIGVMVLRVRLIPTPT